MVSKQRLFFIDYLRAFMVVLVVLEHSFLPYSLHFKNAAYIPDWEDSILFDFCYLYTGAIVIPVLLFISGMFVIPSLRWYGFIKFAEEKLLRLGIPFIIGVFFLSPPQMYARHLIKKDAAISYLDYLREFFFFQTFSISGFWFLSFLLVLMLFTAFVFYLIPSFIRILGSLARWLANNPVKGFICLSFFSSVLLSFGELIWGPFYWIGFTKLFRVQGSKFLLEIFFFMLGVGFAEAHLNFNKTLLDRLSNSWFRWLLISIFIGFLYTAFSLGFYDKGAYYNGILESFPLHNTFYEAWDEMVTYTPFVFTRLILLGFFISSLMIAHYSFFYRFLRRENSMLNSLARSAFGVYIIHEPIQVGLSYTLYWFNLNVFSKFMIVASCSLFISWILIQYLFLKIPGFKKF